MGIKTTAGKKSVIGWMAGNSVAANILMLFLLVGGFFWGQNIKKEVFPEFELDRVVISVMYPGASPEEVEKGIILPVEEVLQNIEGIKEITSTANEGVGSIRAEALMDTDVERLAIDIQNEVDRITSFPVDAEKPMVTIPVRHRGVITLILYGNLEPTTLRETGEFVRDQLLLDKDIQQVEFEGHRPLEIAIEVDQEKLRAHNLTLADVRDRVRAASLDLPGGSIKTSGGEILLRMKERKDFRLEFEKIPIISSDKGALVTLGEIATIHDGFAETDEFLTYNGMDAIGIKVYRIGKQTPVEVADAVLKQVDRLGKTLPDGVFVATVNDRSEIYRQRLHLLLKNGYLGLVLILILLGLFLEPRLAFWVTMGIPISFLGALYILPFYDVSINIVSLFAFIISLGIVVDDTIIVGENVYSYRQKGYSFMEAAVLGTKEMAMPVTFAVLTNIITFMPLYFVPGIMGKIFRHIPVVVAAVFAISLIEALFVLPAHLSHQKSKPTNRIVAAIVRFQERVSVRLTQLGRKVHAPILTLALRYRYVTIAIGLAVLMITGAYVSSGRMGITTFPRIESDLAYCSATLPYGVPVEQTKQIQERLIKTAKVVAEKNGGETLVRGIQSSVNGNSVWVKVFLTPPNERPIPTGAFVKQWRQVTGPIPGLESIRFRSNLGGPGSAAALTVELRHRDVRVLEEASAELADELQHFPIVSDIDDGFSKGKQQLDFTLKADGYRLGLTPGSVAAQVRAAYQGLEIRRQLRSRNEIKILVRFPESERRLEQSLDEMLIKTPKGVLVPLDDVVNIKRGNAFTSIVRRDGRRVNSVTADVNPPSQANRVIESLKEDALKRLVVKYNGLSYGFEGRQAHRKESLKGLAEGMKVALLIIYVVLAIPFRSYIQPAIVMFSIPFGMVGAVLGHMIMGYSLSILSMFGMVALSGVVVNDALILIDLINRTRRKGDTLYAAVFNSGLARFRPIVLTTLTTFFGLMPMIFETSRQAKFLIPMAISLGFGIVFATGITLVMIPCLYLILEDVRRILQYFFSSAIPDPANRPFSS